MRRLVPALVVAGLVLILTATVALAANTKFTVNLKGENEVTVVDSDANGMARLELFPDTDTVCYTIKWQKLDDSVSGAHIHAGAEGVNGGIVITLFGGPLGSPTSFPGVMHTVSDCVSGDGAIIDAILANPDGYYVNVHTGATFTGVIRGQLK